MPDLADEPLVRVLPHSPSGCFQVRQAHLGVFAREDETVGTSFKCGPGSCISVVGRGFAAAPAGRDANVDAGKNFAFALSSEELLRANTKWHKGVTASRLASRERQSPASDHCF